MKRALHSHSRYPKTSPIDESPFPALSEREEAEMEHARRGSYTENLDDEDQDGYPVQSGSGGGFAGGNGSEMGSEADEDEGRIRSGRVRREHERAAREREREREEEEEEEEMRMAMERRLSHERHLESDSIMHDMGLGDRRGGGNGRSSPVRMMASHLMGGMGTARNHFDFSSMDEFADKEKRVLRESSGGYHGAFGTNGMQAKWDGFEEDVPIQIVVPGPTGSRGSVEGSRSILGRSSEEAQEEAHRAGVPEADLIGSADGSVQSNGRMVGGTTVGDAESVRISSPPTQQQDLPTQDNENGEGEAGASTFVRRRQRKSSQSQAVSHGARRQGRLALFEGLGGAFTGDGSARDGSFSVNMPPDDREGPLRGLTSALPTKAARMTNKNTVFGTSGGAGGQDYAKPTGYVDYPDGGRGNGGGERPYRFSFYSNALPATIHARSLSELPSDGQKFEDLFTGREASNSNAPDQRNSGSSDAGGFKSGSTSPQVSNLGELHGSAPNPKLSLLAKATAKAGTGGSPPMKGQAEMDDPEARTWWLDVLSPTDEEMRMLAKVCHCLVSHAIPIPIVLTPLLPPHRRSLAYIP
jgi:magnesium transporter